MPNVRWDVFGATLRLREVLIWSVALVLMIGLQLFVTRTRLGKAMRATAQDAEAARMMGIDVDRVIITAFFLGSALAGAAALIFGLYYNYTSFIIGYSAGLRRSPPRCSAASAALPGDGRRHHHRSDRGAGRSGLRRALDRRDHLLNPGAGSRLRAHRAFRPPTATRS